MSPLSALAPDQRAVLELLLRQGRDYAELSELLGLPESGVRSRAHAALAALAPDRPAPVGEDGAVADWILGQQDDAEAASTRGAIARMPAWHAWASDVTDRLSEVDGAELPELPAARDRRRPRPRRRQGEGQAQAEARGAAQGRPPAPGARRDRRRGRPARAPPRRRGRRRRQGPPRQAPAPPRGRRRRRRRRAPAAQLPPRRARAARRRRGRGRRRPVLRLPRRRRRPEDRLRDRHADGDRLGPGRCGHPGRPAGQGQQVRRA